MNDADIIWYLLAGQGKQKAMSAGRLKLSVVCEGQLNVTLDRYALNIETVIQQGRVGRRAYEGKGRGSKMKELKLVYGQIELEDGN